jgi:hypothetical protein
MVLDEVGEGLYIRRRRAKLISPLLEDGHNFSVVFLHEVAYNAEVLFIEVGVPVEEQYNGANPVLTDEEFGVHQHALPI